MKALLLKSTLLGTLLAGVCLPQAITCNTPGLDRFHSGGYYEELYYEDVYYYDDYYYDDYYYDYYDGGWGFDFWFDDWW